MVISPFELLAALVAAFVVLAIVRLLETRRLERPWRFSLRSLMIAVTVIALAFGLAAAFW